MESTYFVHSLQRLDASHELEGVMTRVVSTNVTFEGTLLNQDTRLMIEQSKVGITRPAVHGALETFIVISTLCFYPSCCLLLV